MGHGRNGTGAYSAARRILISHATLKPKNPCPVCPKGRLYAMKVPGTVVRLVGKAPVEATIYELQNVRCNLCGAIFTAEPPKEAKENKYDETASAMIAIYMKHSH